MEEAKESVMDFSSRNVKDGVGVAMGVFVSTDFRSENGGLKRYRRFGGRAVKDWGNRVCDWHNFIEFKL